MRIPDGEEGHCPIVTPDGPQGVTLLATRATLTGSLAGAVLAPQEYSDGVVWRAHGPWCTGPSTLALTAENLAGKTLAPPDDFLSCALRYCERREQLLRVARQVPGMLWRVLEVADALPLAVEPTSLRAALEAGERDPAQLAAAGPGRVERVPVKVSTIDADGVRHELPDVVGIVAEWDGPAMGPH